MRTRRASGSSADSQPGGRPSYGCWSRPFTANPTTLYYKLLEHAGFTLADVRHLLHEVGLEGALERLYDAGVYVTQDEMKGRRPIERGSMVISTKPADFDSPVGHAVVEGQTSGSTGQPSQANYSFQFLYERTAAESFRRGARVAENRPEAIWRRMEPAWLLYQAKFARQGDKHFTPARFRWTVEGVREQVLQGFTLAAARLFGCPIKLEFVPRSQPLPVVRWLAEMVAHGTPAALSCAPSLAIRVCTYAKEHGFDLPGTLFVLGGEPYTPGKAAVLGSVGASALATFTMREPGGVGKACFSPSELDEVHLEADKLALIQRDKVTSSGAVVPSIVLTGLLPELPKLMLNAETGDYARVFERDCGCPFEEVGYSTHLSHIRGYEKLTSEGVTFLGTLLYDLVEVVLPRRFGGTIGDYQLAEEEDEGVLRVSIVVSPRVGEVNEAGVVETVLENLRSSHELGGELMADQWRQAGTLRVVRREPYQTRTMKVPTLHVSQARIAYADPAQEELQPEDREPVRL